MDARRISSSPHARSGIGLFLFADQALARAGLRALLERGGAWHVLGEGSAPAGQAERVARSNAEVVVCASWCAPLRKLGWLAALKRRSPDCRVLLLAEPAEQPTPSHAFSHGVDGMLPAGAEPYELRLALASIHRGYPWLSPALCAPGARTLSDSP